MNLRFTAAQEAFRAEARAWLEQNVPRPRLPSVDTREGFARHVEWEKKLFEARWAVVSWPEAYGGRNASLMEWLIFEEEYYRAEAPHRVSQNGIFLLAPILFEFGTQEQRDRILPQMASAKQLWAQGWSEPGAGSDLASLRSKAVKVEGGWELSGQKIWCTRAAFCDALFGLFRSNPEEPRHRGLSYFMVPLDRPGVSVHPVRKLDGDEGFADVFFDQVFVPDCDVIGELHGGWKVAMSTTNSERGLTLRSPGRFLATAERLLALYRRCQDHAPAALKDQVLQAWMDAQAYRLYTYETVTRMMAGQPMGASASLNKLFWSEMDLHMHETALALLGERGLLSASAPDAADEGRWLKDFLFALAGPIYAGTNEIQRNIVAERVLGLPRR